MTPQILQSDIDLARRMLQAGSPDDEVVAALVRRRIDPENAALLVNALRNGDLVRPQLELDPEGTLSGSESTPSRASAQGTTPSKPAEGGGGRRRRRVRRSSGPRGLRKAGILLGVLLIASGVGGAILTLYKQYHARTEALLEHLENIVTAPPSPSAESAGAQPGEVGVHSAVLSDFQVLSDQLSRRHLDANEERRFNEALQKQQRRDQQPNEPSTTRVMKPELEIQQDGVHIGGNLITARTGFQALCQTMGPPTRTNQVDQSTNIVYAFDSQGLLLYTQPGAGADSVVLDFEASGGIAGTTSPFTGTLKMDSLVIGRETDSKTLSAAAPVNLSRTGPDGGIFKGAWQGTELYVAYLKNQQRPSLIQINLKKAD